MKKVLIIYATYGMGHKKIAEYISEYFSINGKCEIKNIDILKYSTPILGVLSQKTFEKINFSIPYLWDVIYNSFNKKMKLLPYEKIILGLFKNKKLKKSILEFDPDLIISTHFMGSAIAGYYKRKNKINSKLITIITDYEAHELWLKNINNEDLLIIGNKESRKLLIKEHNIPRNKIKDYGIPISSKFNSSYYNKQKTFKQYNLNIDKKTVIYFCSRGKLTKEYSTSILENEFDCNLIVITGNNYEEKNRLTKLNKEYKNKCVKILGFVDSIPELLNIADMVITKPGGATVTECLYFHKPMLFIGKSSGQERANAKYLTKNGIAYIANDKKEMVDYINILTETDKYLDKMKECSKKICKNDAMEKLYKEAIKLIGK